MYWYKIGSQKHYLLLLSSTTEKHFCPIIFQSHVQIVTTHGQEYESATLTERSVREEQHTRSALSITVTLKNHGCLLAQNTQNHKKYVISRCVSLCAVTVKETEVAGMRKWKSFPSGFFKAIIISYYISYHNNKFYTVHNTYECLSFVSI